MKDVYYNNFLKYATFIKSKSFESLADVMEEVSDIVIPKVDSEEEKKALVMFGFSGNGKTTWINNWCLENPEYVVLSMDSVVRELSDKLGRQVDGMEITKAFSEKLDEVCSNNKNVVVDGNVITSKSAGTALDFAFEIIKYLKDENIAEKVKNAIYY